MEFTKLILNANSCYMDSLFIFILLYKNTPFFSNLYTKIDLENNTNIPNSLKKDNDIITEFANIPQYFNNLYNNICKNNNSSNVNACRLNIRKNLNKIGSILAKNNISKFERNWLTDQQDSSELLDFLIYIYNIKTNINYDIYKCYEYNSQTGEYNNITEQKYKEQIDKLKESHRADYIGNKIDYYVTTNIEKGFKIFSNKIIDPITKKKKPRAINTKPNALIVFNKWDVINLTNRSTDQTDNDAFILVNYKINVPPPIFIIQINRLLKFNNEVKFDNTNITIPKYINNPNNNANADNYILIGGTIHSGGTNGGHYTAYILNPSTDKYFYYDNKDGKWNVVGDYEKLIKTNFKSHCSLLFYILKSDYEKQKSTICPDTQEISKSSSYESATNTSYINTLANTPKQTPVLTSDTVCTGNESSAKCNATGVTQNSRSRHSSSGAMGLEFSVSGINIGQINFINY